MKKILSLIITVSMLLTAFTAVRAEEDVIEVLVDGKYVEFDVNPMLVDDRTLVPVRAVFNALGAEVDWNGDTQTVTAVKGDTTISMVLYENVLVKNGEGILLDTKSILVDDRILVPLRAVSEAFDCNVQWNPYNTSVIVISDPSTVTFAVINGEEISLDEFNTNLFFWSDSFYSNNPGAAESLSALWTEYSSDIAQEIFNEIAFKKEQIKNATDEDVTAAKAEAEATFALLVQNIGGSEAMEKLLKKNNITENGIKNYFTQYFLTNTMLLKAQAEISEKELKQYISDNFYCAKHILFEKGETVEETAAKKELAENTLKKIKGGNDFDTLMMELCEDPGLQTNPDGYTFTSGEMVAEFENAVKELGIGQISEELVETAYGFHIIKREPVDFEATEEQARYLMLQDKISTDYNSEAENVSALIFQFLPIDFTI